MELMSFILLICKHYGVENNCLDIYNQCLLNSENNKVVCEKVLVETVSERLLKIRLEL